jgi:hypothetical protein
MNIRIILGPVLVLLSSAFDLHAEEDACTPVLQYTGRETKVFWSQQIGRKFSEEYKSRSQSQGAKGSLPGVPFEILYANARSADSKARFGAEWNNSDYSAMYTVVEPAIQAWSQCEQAESHNLHLKPDAHDGEELTVSLWTSALSGCGVPLTGVDYDPAILACRHDGQLLKQDTRAVVGSNAYNIICSRVHDSLKETSVDLITKAGNFSLKLPQKAGPMVSYIDPRHTTAIDISGCSVNKTFDAKPFPRSIYQADIVTRFDGLRGNRAEWYVDVAINGRVDHVTGAIPAGNYEGGGVLGGRTWDVAAFEPLHVELRAGSTPGGCKSVKAVLYDPNP